MHDRRSFLTHVGILTSTTALGRPASTFGDEPTSSGSGQSPDTLELAEQGRLAIGGILGGLNPSIEYEATFLTILDTNPVYMLHWSSMVSGVMTKYIEALPMLRLMSGSNEQRQLEAGFMEAMLRNMEEDGLVYDRKRANRPWNVGVTYGKKDWDEDYANIAGNGRMLAGFAFWHQTTGKKVWLTRAKKTAERMYELAVVDGDFAYYPNPGLGNDFSYPRKSGWTTTKAPERPNEGFEGATLFYLCQPLRGFAQYVTWTGDERFLDLSQKMVDFVLQPKFWGGEDGLSKQAGFERGHFGGHFHGTLAALRGLLDYARVANDQRVLEFVQDAYHFARERGVHRLGVFPGSPSITEGCTIADMIGLAIALSDAGLGDYWDDVAVYSRNGLVSAQVTDISELKRVASAGKERPQNSNWGGHFDSRFRHGNRGALPGQEIHERALERTMGQFTHLSGASHQVPQTMACCSANCSQALYYVWEGVTRRNGDTATVNLWMNRRAPWIDVFSRLPYEGRLDLHNKGLRQLAIRVPGWIKRHELRCSVNGQKVTPKWVGNRAVFNDLQGAEHIVLDAPLRVETADYSLISLNSPTTKNDRLHCEFKGDTAIRVTTLDRSPDESPDWYRLFRREEMLSNELPTKRIADYVHPERLVQWQPL